MNTPDDVEIIGDVSNANLVEADNSQMRELYIALERLEANPDFQKVIVNGYFTKRAVDQVSMLAHQHVISAGIRGQIIEDLVGISRLQDYFRVIRALGRPYTDEELAEMADDV